MKSKKGLFSLFEIAFTLMLIGGVMIYGIYSSSSFHERSYGFQSKSFLHTYEFEPETREILFEEDLTQNSVVLNWTNVTDVFDDNFLNYGLLIGNITDEKSIVNCDNSSYTSKRSYQKIFFSNESGYSSRILTLEVCY